MSTREFATQMKAMIEDLKAQRIVAINCDNLIQYLGEIQKTAGPEPSPLELENFKSMQQNWIEGNKHANEFRREMFRSVITAGQGAIRSSFLLNGGAAVALLAFIAHLTQISPGKVGMFAGCLLPFVIGVLVATATSGFTYLSQWLYASSLPRAVKVGFGLNIFCIALGLASYVLFAWGIVVANRAFLNFV